MYGGHGRRYCTRCARIMHGHVVWKNQNVRTSRAEMICFGENSLFQPGMVARYVNCNTATNHMCKRQCQASDQMFVSFVSRRRNVAAAPIHERCSNKRLVSSVGLLPVCLPVTVATTVIIHASTALLFFGISSMKVNTHYRTGCNIVARSRK